MKYTCEYCNKSFVRESTVERHMCKEKQRMLTISEKDNVIAFSLYNSWQRLAMNKKHESTYEQFSKSNYFMIFVKLAKYIISSNISNSDEYLKWLIYNKINSRIWCKDSTYARFHHDMLEKETPERALEKFVLLANSWASEHNKHWSDFWSDANHNLIIHHISMGHISPWILLCANSAVKFMNNLPEETLNDIATKINIDFWNTRIKSYKKEVEWIKELLK